MMSVTNEEVQRIIARVRQKRISGNEFCCSACGRPWTDEPVGLTSKQREVLLFIYRHAKANDGVPPSFDQIRGALGLKSKSGIHRLVSSLVERGALVTLPYRARAMAITPRGLNTIGKAT